MTKPAIEVSYEHEGQSHKAHVVPADLGPNTTLFYFFDQHNAEVMVKVLDGHAMNGYWWVFVAVLSDLPVQVAVTAESGAVWSCHSSSPTARTDLKALH